MAGMERTGDFAPTRWSIVIAAGASEMGARRKALAILLEIYWYPLFVFARRTGYSSTDAEDRVQDFFVRLIEKSVVADADPKRGRFRSFLLSSFRHFLSNQHDREHAQKRGGGEKTLSLDFDTAEARYRQEPAHDMTPERLFDRRWALQLLDSVLAQVRSHYDQSNQLALFEALKPLLTGHRADQEAYTVLAKQLQMSAGAIKTAAHRMRRQYRKTLRNAIADTVAGETEIDDELRHLLDAVKSTGRV